MPHLNVWMDIEHKVLQRIYGPKKEVLVAGKTLHKEQLCNLYSPHNTSKSEGSSVNIVTML